MIINNKEYQSNQINTTMGSFLLVCPHEKLLGLLGLLGLIGLGLGLGLTLMLTLAQTLTLIALTIIFRGGGLTGKNPTMKQTNKQEKSFSNSVIIE